MVDEQLKQAMEKIGLWYALINVQMDREDMMPYLPDIDQGTIMQLEHADLIFYDNNWYDFQYMPTFRGERFIAQNFPDMPERAKAIANKSQQFRTRQITDVKQLGEKQRDTLRTLAIHTAYVDAGIERAEPNTPDKQNVALLDYDLIMVGDHSFVLTAKGRDVARDYLAEGQRMVAEYQATEAYHAYADTHYVTVLQGILERLPGVSVGLAVEPGKRSYRAFINNLPDAQEQRARAREVFLGQRHVEVAPAAAALIRSPFYFKVWRPEIGKPYCVEVDDLAGNFPILVSSTQDIINLTHDLNTLLTVAMYLQSYDDAHAPK